LATPWISKIPPSSLKCALPLLVLHWNSEDPSLSRVLLKVLVEDPLEIPRSLIVKTGREDGKGRSWTVPVYLFNSSMVNAEPADEEDPFHGPMVPGEQDFVAHLAD
jgi:hypothetical protein